MAPLHTTGYGEQGPRVVFCHGLFGQGRNWTQLARSLAGEHRVLTVDMPQHGRSPWSPELDYLAMADQVAGLLDPADPVTLVGHSMGGKIAMALALRHPALVERLAVVDVAPVAYDRMGVFEGYVAAMRSVDLAGLASRGQAEEQLTPGVPDPVVRGFLLQNLRRVRGEDGTESWRWQMNLDVLGDRLDVIGGWPAERLVGVAPFDQPTLWVGGEHSDYVTDAHEGAMRRWFPRARRVTVKGAGHWVHSEQPATFLAVLRRFLGS